MEPLPSTSWDWPDIVGTDRILSETIDVLNDTSQELLTELTELSSNQYKEPTDNNLTKLPDEQESVAGLLEEWGVPELESHFSENKVDLISLKYARVHQLSDLLQHIPWGIKVKFEHSLFKWQKSIGTNLPEDVPSIQSATQKSLVVEKILEKTDHLNSPQFHKDESDALFDLKSVLSHYNEGKSILKLIDLNVKELPEAQRQILVDKIVDYFIQNDRKMSVALARTITNQILCLFPEEIKEYYFAPQTNKAPKGKLLAKYYNQMRKLKSIGLIDVPLVAKRKKQTNLPELPEPEENAMIIKEKLKFRQESERWDEVKEMWQKCQHFRRKFLLEEESKNILNILNEWPCYKHPLGSTLIDLDFQMILPKAESIYSKWSIFVNIAVQLFKTKIKDRNCKRILEELETKTVSEEGLNVAILFLLHAVIVPTSKKTVKTGPRKVLVKFTITDSQDSFLVTGRSINEVEGKLIQRKYQNQPIQPFLIVIFEDEITNPKQYLVCCDQIKYTFLSIVPALDCCFKLFHVFNLEYPLESVSVWQFIQQFFYDIQSQHDVVIPSVTLFLNEVKKKLNALETNT